MISFSEEFTCRCLSMHLALECNFQQLPQERIISATFVQSALKLESACQEQCDKSPALSTPRALYSEDGPPPCTAQHSYSIRYEDRRNAQSSTTAVSTASKTMNKNA
jgi:hypothetical protein